MPQIGFPLDKAHQALDEFLAEMQSGEEVYERWISKGDDIEKADVGAYIVAADDYDRMYEGYRSWMDSQEVVEQDADLPPGYRPWRHSPLATTERLLPIEPLYDPLSRVFYGKPYEELPAKPTLDEVKAGVRRSERDKVEVAAIASVLRVTLDPDGQGAVPVMMIGHQPDEPGNGLRWQLAFVTKVPGLFVRVTGNGFFGGEWGIVTGSGFVVRGGYLERESAEAAAEALGRTLPNADWMRIGPDDYTPAAKAAIVATLSRYQQWGLAEDKPEPEPMTDPVPAEALPGM